MPVQRVKLSTNTVARQGKLALVLAGGGITGVMYEVGALRAMNELLVDRTVNDFDIYVGTSAGALVGALVANGFTPAEILQIIDQSHPEVRNVQVGDVFHVNLQDVIQRVSHLPRALYRVGRDLLTHRTEVALTDLLWELAEILPSGFYSMAALEQYVRSVLTQPGRFNHFDQLAKDLYIVATELDSGRRTIFGRSPQTSAPISLAVAASGAVPLLYRPVQIGDHDYVDGGLHGAASLDLAIEAGARLVVCINPLAPLDVDQAQVPHHYIREHGFHAVINQSVRTLFHAGVRYHVKNLRAKHADVDIILIEPHWDDQAMFRYNPMHYRSRLAVAEHGFRSVTEGLLENQAHFRRVLARHGIPFHTTPLETELATLAADAASAAPARSLLNAVVDLEKNLRRLNTLTRPC